MHLAPMYSAAGRIGPAISAGSRSTSSRQWARTASRKGCAPSSKSERTSETYTVDRTLLTRRGQRRSHVAAPAQGFRRRRKLHDRLCHGLMGAVLAQHPRRGVEVLVADAVELPAGGERTLGEGAEALAPAALVEIARL